MDHNVFDETISTLEELMFEEPKETKAPVGTIPFRVKPLSEIDSMDGYLGSYGKILGHKAIHALTPLHIPGQDELPDMGELLREPFPCQKHVIAAAGKMMDRVGSGFIVGEMGTGKTLLGMVSAHKHASKSRKQGGKGGNYRALILCPDHLIGKWCREIEETIPGAKAARFGSAEEEAVASKKKGAAKPESGTRRTLRDVVSLLSKGQGGRWSKPQGAEWYVLGRNQAKWLSDWVGIADLGTRFGGKTSTKSLSAKSVVVDKVFEKDDYGRVTGSKNVHGTVYACPKCGNRLVDKKGVPMAEKDFSAKTKGATQKTCQGLYAVEIPEAEKPRHEGLDRISPLPSRFADKKPADRATGRPADTFSQAGRRYRVMSCGEPLYNYVSKPVRWSPARIIQKKMRRFFDYLIIDEVHEQKSDESAQSMACGKLISSARHTLALTGTIIGGYAHHLFPLMMRLTPRSLRDEGFEWGKDLAFSEKYGRIDRIVKTSEEGGSTSVAGNAKSMRRAKTGDQKCMKVVRPGVMPTMFGRHMIGSSMFITLEELADELPDLFEYIGGPEPAEPSGATEDELDRHDRSIDGWYDTAVPMTPEQAAEYNRIKSRLEEANKDILQAGSMKLLGAYLWTTMDYPDKPFGWGHDLEVRKAIDEREADQERQAPGLLGQAFLGNFDYQFDSAATELVLSKTVDGVTETDRIPLRSKGGIFWLDVTFNGNVTKALAYDTGAASISLPEAMANEIGLRPKQGDTIVMSQIADGSLVRGRGTKISSVTVGKFTVRDVECVIQPQTGLPHTVGYWKIPGDRKIDNWVGVVTPADLPEDVTYPKEQALIDICKMQKKDGRQTWVYVQMTGKRNIQPRLKKLLEAEGLKVGVLRSTDVNPIDREAWIAQNGRDYDVMISHPSLVSTGLDLFSKASGGHNYSTLVFYETGYNLFTMRQAARRAWRIGQPRDCRVYYLYYRDTMQHNAMSLMSRKMAAAQALEGEFSEDGLAAMAGENNLQMALAKSLADRIDDSDMQRSWGKVKSGPKKRKPGDELAKAANPEPSLFDGLPTELQLVGEALAKSEAFSRKLDEFNANPEPTMKDGLELDAARLDAAEALVKQKESDKPAFECSDSLCEDECSELPTCVHGPDDDEDDEEGDFFADFEDDDDDDDFEVPEMTAETLAKMFANITRKSD